LRIDVLASTDDFPVIAVFDRITKHPGSKIALAVTDSTNQTVIKIMDEDGTNLRAITSGPLDTQPSWSPDGRKIVFARQTHSGGTTNQSIQVVNADGTGLTALTSGPSDAAPAWAPDGSRIAFVGPSAPFGAIFLMNPDGTNVVNTGVKVFGSKLSWSPDSKQIVYSNYDEDGSGTVRLYVWAVAGGGSTKLSTPACQPWGATAPDWSSTGTIGFFCDTHGNPNGNLWLATMAATGGGYKPVTGNLYGKVIGGPIWSPDGSKFAYGEGTGIVIVPEDGGPSTETLSLGGGRLAWMDWGP
jgi:Tol biopolymer transport system component